MLVLSRRLGEKILFPGIGAYVKVVSVKGGTVRLCIEAPPEVLILREELLDGTEFKRDVDAGTESLKCD